MGTLDGRRQGDLVLLASWGLSNGFIGALGNKFEELLGSWGFLYHVGKQHRHEVITIIMFTACAGVNQEFYGDNFIAPSMIES